MFFVQVVMWVLVLHVTSYRLKVKALNFHFNNVGSSPASLTINNKFRVPTGLECKKDLTLRKFFALSSPESKCTPGLVYSLRFSSLFTPHVIKNLRLYLRANNGVNAVKYSRSKDAKVLVKQSYLMLVWFLYVSRGYNLGEKSHEKLQIPGFFVYPRRFTKFTILKTPMAHKTYSQEQFVFTSYIFTITFRTNFGNAGMLMKESGLLFIDYFSVNYLFFGTNMLFLRKLRLLFLVRGLNFFSYFYFMSIK